MKVSRAPEKRGGANRTVVYVSLIFAAIIVGVLVTYFTTGRTYAVGLRRYEG
jgi:hypothetical protein